MKQRKIWFFIPFFLFLMISIFGITVSAAYYEPDGSSSVEFLCDTSEVNRTLIVKCVDESGNLIKEVTYRCKHGDDDLISLSIYGYDIVGFDSDHMQKVKYRDPATPMGVPQPLFTGVIPNIKYNQGWTWDASVTVEQSEPLPMNILAIAPLINEQDK